ncbi:MAG: metallophosphoesterase [Candidatus Omnitrophica bacterium]|nr:metallophosphoesterase [Candidatus Omnitrophota bacterium]
MKKRNLQGGEMLVGRREFLGGAALGVLSLGAGNAGQASAGQASAGQADVRPLIRFGMVTDAHYADADARGTRFYCESRRKMGECAQLMNEQRTDFLIELGDFKDQDSPPDEAKTMGYLRDIEREFQRFQGPRYHAGGNHDFDSLSKKQFLSLIENAAATDERLYYSFERRGFRFIVLDANYRADGADYDHGNFDWKDANIPPDELEWLREELGASKKPAVVFVHQLLDGEGDVFVRNAEQVRRVLEESGRAHAVFQGHHHAGRFSRIGGIPYYTLKGMIEGSGRENSAYAIVEIYGDGRIKVVGCRRADSRTLI